MQADHHPSDRPADQDWPPHPREQDSRLPPRRPQQQWSPGREHAPDHRGHSPSWEWSQKGNWYDEESGMPPRPEGSYGKEFSLVERSHDGISDENKRIDMAASSDADASVHEAVAQLAEQMKSVKGLASKLNLPNSPKTAKEWQEVAKMVAAAAATGGNSGQQQQRGKGEDDTQKRVAAMLANDSDDDSDTEKPPEVKKQLSPAREFDGTYVIPPEFRKPEDDQCYSMDYGHGEPHLSRRPHDYPPDDPYRRDHPPLFWDRREHERFPPGRPYRRPLSPPPPLHRHHFPPDHKGFPPPHSSHPSDWYDGGRPRTPPYPQYGPPLPHDIPSSMLDEMTSDQQLLLAAAVNSGSGKKQ